MHRGGGDNVSEGWGQSKQDCQRYEGVRNATPYGDHDSAPLELDGGRLTRQLLASPSTISLHGHPTMLNRIERGEEMETKCARAVNNKIEARLRVDPTAETNSHWLVQD